MGDRDQYKSAISTSRCISLLCEFMKNYDTCYVCYMLTVNED